MACQTGIGASDPLRQFFVKCKTGKVRIVKIIIKNEELSLNYHDAPTDNWERDFGRLSHCLDQFEPCYLLFRLDSLGPHGNDWLLISFADDSASIRDKMLLAATRATLKAEFGQTYIRQEYHATSKVGGGMVKKMRVRIPIQKDCTLDGYKRWVLTKTMTGPMTGVEQELNTALEENATVATGPAGLTGVVFPVDQAVEEQLGMLSTGDVTYVQLSVDTLNEAIKLERSDCVTVHDLAPLIPRNKPRYHFFRFEHTFEGDTYKSLVFMYSIPSSSSCSIKERMLYSTCKGPFLEMAERFMGLKPDRKLEIDSSESVTKHYLLDQLHPKSNLRTNFFPKPKGPPNRGFRRLAKPAIPTN